MKIIVTQKPVDLLEAFCLHYCQRDMNALLSLFTKDALVWGTGADEVRRGLSEIEQQICRDWSQSEACEFVIESTETDPDNPNWIGTTVKANVTIDGAIQHLFLRGTIITKNVDGLEKIRFFHSSFPAPNQEIGKSYPVL